ncbi:MAG: hypothetical protein HC911_07400 [Chloroflexaceae bacterium]|nr:hypothetical protein [Chloroflexaceae bacterium]
MHHTRRLVFWRGLLCAICLIGWLGTGGTPAAAAGTVGTGTPASCTEASLTAALSGGGTLTFNCGTAPHTIRITRALNITTATTINGGGAVTLDGDNATRLFSVSSNGQLTLTAITLSGGNAGTGNGGAINNNGGVVTLDGVVLTGNRARSGGALYNGVGTATIRNSTFANNTATEGGGAINYYHENRPRISMTVEASTFTANTANIGGAISAGGSGGATQALLIVNSTLAANSAVNSGALYSRRTTTTIIASTFAANRASEYAAGIFNSQGTLAAANTIMSNDLSGARENCAGTITNLGGNLQFPGNTCGPAIRTADPLLAPLAANGGVTLTMLPGQGSPAIDGGITEQCPPTDQRGSPRPTNGDEQARCDSGAVELAAGSTPPNVGNVVGTGTPASCTAAALQAAVARSGAISFNCGAAPHTITLSAEMRITQDTNIDGGGQITLSGAGRTRIFAVEMGQHLVVQNLTLRDGKAADGRGGAIYAISRSRLTVLKSTFENNDGTAGLIEFGAGAIYSDKSPVIIRESVFRSNRGANGGAVNITNAALTIENSLFEDNDSTAGGPAGFGFGGAIYLDGASDSRDGTVGGEFILRNTIIRNNRGAGEGGGVYSWLYPPDTATMEGLLFEGNSISPNNSGAANGGGLIHGNVPLTMRDTTFLNNIARNAGGGFYLTRTGVASLTNVTVYGNRAEPSTGTGGYGGGIGGAGVLGCNHCTILRNHAGANGGGLYDLQDSQLSNSIIAHNTADNEGNSWGIFQNCRTTLQQTGTVIQFPAKTGSTNDRDCTASATIAEPRYAAPANNGGRVPTVALLEGSIGIDAGTPATCAARDARGAPRTVGSACDVGAFEFGSDVPSFRQYLPAVVRR